MKSFVDLLLDNKSFNQMMRKTVFFILSSFFFSCQLLAQSTDKTKTTTFKLQFDYLSDYVYNGRADSIKYPYQITTASVNFANGVYINLGADYLLTPGEERVDFFQLDLGYDFEIDKKWTGTVYGTKFFYSSQSALINGNISSDFGASINYDAGFLQMNNSLDVFFANKADLQWTTGFEKNFTNEKNNSKWSFDPGVYANISSLNYYESEVSRRLRPKNSGIKAANPINIISSTKTNQTGLKLMALECSFPMSYETEHIGFSIYPTYAIPFNAVTTTTVTKNKANNNIINTVNSTPYSELNLDNRWYVQAGIYFKF